MMRASQGTDAPTWAETLVELVMAHEGIASPPSLIWWTDGPLPEGHKASNSSGVTLGDCIAVDAGASGQDARHTLIHELAHWSTDSGHTPAMYAKLYELLWLFGEAGDMEYARVREAAYQPESAQLGWARFLARTQTWAARASDYAERMISSPLPRAALVALAVALGVDSLQQVG